MQQVSNLNIQIHLSYFQATVTIVPFAILQFNVSYSVLEKKNVLKT